MQHCSIVKYRVKMFEVTYIVSCFIYLNNEVLFFIQNVYLIHLLVININDRSL